MRSRTFSDRSVRLSPEDVLALGEFMRGVAPGLELEYYNMTLSGELKHQYASILENMRVHREDITRAIASSLQFALFGVAEHEGNWAMAAGNALGAHRAKTLATLNRRLRDPEYIEARLHEIDGLLPETHEHVLGLYYSMADALRAKAVHIKVLQMPPKDPQDFASRVKQEPGGKGRTRGKKED